MTIKSRDVRFAEHDKHGTYKIVQILVEHHQDKRSLGRIILKWILKQNFMIVWTGFIWLKIRSSDELL
jgi:hypothetical protein